MKTRTLAFAGLAAALSTASPANAASITFKDDVIALPGYTTATVIQSFDQSNGLFEPNTTLVPTTIGTEVVSGGGIATISGGNPDLLGQFLTLGNGASYTLTLNQPVQFLSFLIDGYRATNHVKLTFADGSTNSNILNHLDGLGAGDNGIVVIDALGLSGVKTIRFQTGSGPNNSFNFDQIAVAAPEPGTWAMMILGFGIIGMQLRSRRRRPIPATA